MAKTIRFGDLVRQSGRPEALTLWTDPKRDKRLTKAIRENRVLTVIQEPASKKKDFGRIGFHQNPFASYFVFPRPLAERGDSRIVGINYELAEEAAPKGPLAVARPARKPGRERVSNALGTLPAGKTGGASIIPARRRRSRSSVVAAVRPRESRPVPRRFTVILKRRAELETAIEVKALEQEAAREQALNRIRRKRFDGAKAIVRDEVLSVSEANR